MLTATWAFLALHAHLIVAGGLGVLWRELAGAVKKDIVALKAWFNKKKAALPSDLAALEARVAELEKKLPH